MSRGTSITWEVGPRNVVGNTVQVGKGSNARTVFEPRLGKNKGPVISQIVTKIIGPKKAA